MKRAHYETKKHKHAKGDSKFWTYFTNWGPRIYMTLSSLNIRLGQIFSLKTTSGQWKCSTWCSVFSKDSVIVPRPTEAHYFSFSVREAFWLRRNSNSFWVKSRPWFFSPSFSPCALPDYPQNQGNRMKLGLCLPLTKRWKFFAAPLNMYPIGNSSCYCSPLVDVFHHVLDSSKGLPSSRICP